MDPQKPNVPLSAVAKTTLQRKIKLVVILIDMRDSPKASKDLVNALKTDITALEEMEVTNEEAASINRILDKIAENYNIPLARIAAGPNAMMPTDVWF
jgi:hypothetical protein